MAVHFLKTINPYFQDVWDETKQFEVRKNDRDFRVNDIVFLEEYDKNTKIYSGRDITVQITYILNNSEYCKEGFIIFGFKLMYKGNDSLLDERSKSQ